MEQSSDGYKVYLELVRQLTFEFVCLFQTFDKYSSVQKVAPDCQLESCQLVAYIYVYAMVHNYKCITVGSSTLSMVGPE